MTNRLGSRRALNILLLALLAPVLPACSDRSPTPANTAAARTERSLPVQGYSVTTRDLSRSVRLSAPVEALRLVDLAARTDGILLTVLVEEGDTVKADQVLAQIDVREQVAELARAEAALAEQRSANQRLDRLKPSNYIDEATVEAARAALASAEAEKVLWETRVDFGTARASLDGVIVARYVEPGAAVARLAPLFTIADVSTLVVRVAASELDVTGIQAGQQASVRVDAAGSEPLAGRVRRVFPAADAESRLTTVEIELLDASDLGVRPGFLARAELVVDAQLDKLAVPLAAIAQGGDGLDYVMVVDAEDRLQRRVVTLGMARGVWREVVEGLDRGERLVASNPVDLREGALVRIVNWLSEEA